MLGGCATTPPALDRPERVRTVSHVDKRIFPSDAALLDIVRDDYPGCSAAVGVRGEIVWAGARGIANRRTKEPVTTSTRFDMASVAKQFTATAILMLKREGALKLSDPVSRYVSGLPAWGRQVTIEQLMHHTARVPDYWVELDRHGIGFMDKANHRRILDAIRALPDLDPGTGYLYSNSNYVLLAEVVKKASGMALPEFLDTRIFTPLGLDMELTPSLKAPDVALSYDDDLSYQPPGWTAYGAIGIYTTPSELARWGDQYRESPLGIIQADFAEGAVPEGEGEKYGAGIDIEPDGDLNHNGRFGGYISAFTVSADRETTVVVMCNGHLSPRWELNDALWEIWVTGVPADEEPGTEAAP